MEQPLIVVTGGAGFIGSCLVAALEARGRHGIVVVDRLRHGDKWRNLAKRELADIVAPEALDAFLAANAGRIETIFHLGAISATTATDADLVIDSNFRLTMRLWAWCAENRVRFVYASSAATYGDGLEGFADDPAPEALARLRPLNPYGWSKHLTDRRIARALANGEPTPPQWAGLKFFNVYGPNEYHKGGQQSVVPQLHRQIAETGTARLFRSYRSDIADGGQSRDFVWVEDVTAAMLWLLDTPGVSGLFNVGTGRARSFTELAHAVFAACGKTPEIAFIDMPDAIRDRYQYWTEAPLGRLRAAGYDRPFTSLEDGVGRYVRAFLAAPDPYL